MRRVFLESNGYNMVGFIFSDGMVAFDCTTIDEAIHMDYSGVRGCKSAEEAAVNCNTEVIPFIEGEWESVVEIGEIKIARHNAGISQQQMSNLFDIPKRTIENWESGSRSCPEWTEDLIVEKLNRFQHRRPIMHAIARQIDWLWDVICNPKNEGKDMTAHEDDIIALANEYFSLRGHSGRVSFVAGMDDEANTVSAIRDMVHQDRGEDNESC